MPLGAARHQLRISAEPDSRPAASGKIGKVKGWLVINNRRAPLERRAAGVVSRLYRR